MLDQSNNKRVVASLNKKVAIVGIVGVPANYGGFETLAENLLVHPDCDFSIYCSSSVYKDHIRHYKGARLYYIPLSANGVQSVFYDIISIFHGLLIGHRQFLVLGVSGALLFPLLKFVLPNVKLITNIDGLEWKRNKWSKFVKKYLKFSERIAVKYSDTIISDNQTIANYVLAEYSIKSEVIAYGGDHALVQIESEPQNYFFAVCRIEPENNIHVILEAFLNTNKPLKFVGNWDNSQYGIDLKNKFGSIGNIEIIDPVYDIQELANLRSGCYAYVHGHSAGGTNPSLVEMMHFGKPIIAYDCAYNKSTMENSGIFFSDSLELQQFVDKEIDQKIGAAMKEIAKRRYTWDKIIKQYFELFM